MLRSFWGLAVGGLVVLAGCATSDLPEDLDAVEDEQETDSDGADPENDAPESDPQAACNLDADVDPPGPVTEPIANALDDLADPLDPQAGVYEVGKPWPKRNLSVCFKGQGYATERGWIRDAIRASWEAVSGVTFSGWGTCSGAGAADITIELDNLGAGGQSEFGTASSSAYPSMRISVHFPAGGCGAGTSGCNNDVAPNGKTNRRNCVEGIAIHEFGHALALRHEQAHPDETCAAEEELDPNGLDGEPLWSYDPSSVMNYCNGSIFTSAKLSYGDVRTINSLYPSQVVAFSGMNWTGEAQPLAWGSWRACAGDLAFGSDISSLVVPPGLRAKVCTDAEESYCRTYWGSTNLNATLRDNVGKIVVDAYVPVYDGDGFTGPTYQYLYPGTYLANESDLLWVGNDRIASMLVPPNTSARLCEHEGAGNGSGACYSRDGDDPMSHTLPATIRDRASFVQVRKRVATYDRALYRGEVHSYDVGTYRVDNGTLKEGTKVSSLAIPTGMNARVCTSEGTGNGGGTCVTYSRSQDDLPATLDNQIRFMQVGTPFFLPFEPLCIGGALG